MLNPSQYWGTRPAELGRSHGRSTPQSTVTRGGLTGADLYYVEVSEPVSHDTADISAPDISAPDISEWMRPDAILLHIGVHKTGTTAIQSALAQADEVLAGQGILYPAPRSHFDTGMAALGRQAGWDRSDEPRDRSKWLDVVKRSRRHSGRVLFSSEVLCEADDEAARRLIDELGSDRVQVLITLRPLEALLPSTWQQYLKSGYSLPYRRWLRRVLKSTESTTTRSFWRRNDHGRLVERWGALVGAENVAVLVVNPLDRFGLYRDFERLLGLPEGSLVPTASAPGNRSLSAAEAEALRRFNKRMRDEMPYAAYHRLIRRGAALTLVEGRKPDLEEPTIMTPPWAVERAREYGEASVKRILATGSPVFGEVDLLTPTHEVARPEKQDTTTIPVDIAPLLLEGAVRASLGQKFAGAPQSAASGLSMVSWRSMAGELAGRARRRVRRSTR